MFNVRIMNFRILHENIGQYDFRNKFSKNNQLVGR